MYQQIQPMKHNVGRTNTQSITQNEIESQLAIMSLASDSPQFSDVTNKPNISKRPHQQPKQHTHKGMIEMQKPPSWLHHNGSGETEAGRHHLIFQLLRYFARIKKHLAGLKK
ncbi:hypothetical protein Tcan_00536, partial [Toxocara canis]